MSHSRRQTPTEFRRWSTATATRQEARIRGAAVDIVLAEAEAVRDVLAIGASYLHSHNGIITTIVSKKGRTGGPELGTSVGGQMRSPDPGANMSRPIPIKCTKNTKFANNEQKEKEDGGEGSQSNSPNPS